jgi:excisionase family DNA binding protein
MSSSILTLEELADYLKLSPEVVLSQANQGRLPGRKIEDTWRFLKDAIDDWLRTQDSRAILLQQAGVFADDPALEEIRRTVYESRGRSKEAWVAIQALVGDRLDVEVLPVLPLEVSLKGVEAENPWTEFIGMFEGDTEFAEMAAQLRAERELEADEGA